MSETHDPHAPANDHGEEKFEHFIPKATGKVVGSILGAFIGKSFDSGDSRGGTGGQGGTHEEDHSGGGHAVHDEHPVHDGGDPTHHVDGAADPHQAGGAPDAHHPEKKDGDRKDEKSVNDNHAKPAEHGPPAAHSKAA